MHHMQTGLESAVNNNMLMIWGRFSWTFFASNLSKPKPDYLSLFVFCELLQGKLFWLCALFLSDREGGSRFHLCLASTTAEFSWLCSRPQYKPRNFLLACNNYEKNRPLQSYFFAKTKIRATVKCVNILSLTKLWNSLVSMQTIARFQ